MKKLLDYPFTSLSHTMGQKKSTRTASYHIRNFSGKRENDHLSAGSGVRHVFITVQYQMRELSVIAARGVTARTETACFVLSLDGWKQ